MTAIRIVSALLMSGCASVGLACEVPALMNIPTTDTIKENPQGFYTEWLAYRDGMQAYITCTQEALKAAGGDSAPAILKATLVKRNNDAVKEYTAVAAVFDARVAPLVKQAPVDIPIPEELAPQ